MLKSQLVVATVLCASGLFAQNAPGVKGEFLSDVATLEKKFIGLAEAIPADKYSWRPGEGVRSVSEVFVHVAGADVMTPARTFDMKPPDFISRDMEKTVTDKAKVVDLLKQSFEYLRHAADSIGDPDRTVKLYGRDVTARQAAFAMLAHLHEHLGQMIAYARVNGVVPPWSQRRA